MAATIGGGADQKKHRGSHAVCITSVLIILMTKMPSIILFNIDELKNK